jgi:hypothetical protein
MKKTRGRKSRSAVPLSPLEKVRFHFFHLQDLSLKNMFCHMKQLLFKLFS